MITNSNEACKVLGVNPGASADEVKSAFRKLSKQLHPDVNKADDAEQKFKEINEAYQFIQKHGSNYTATKDNFSWNTDWINIQDEFIKSVFVNFGQYNTINFKQTTINNNVIHGNIDLTFNESILGVKKDVTYSRKVVCEKCEGKCYISTSTNEVCDNCNGAKEKDYHGRKQVCIACAGTGSMNKKIQCETCLAKGTIRKDSSVTLDIPPGTRGGQIYSVEYAGDYNISNINKWGPARFRINVAQHESIKRIDDNNLISEINLTLLEALKGVTKKVETVYGEKSLVIPPKRRHLDNVVAKGLGVKNLGDHYFILKVDYPDDVQPLIDMLEKENHGV